MRSGHNKSRNRSRHRSTGGGGSSSGGGGGGNPLSRIYESNGPDVKVRGTAQTVADKYMQLGRDAQVAGDIVMAESYHQFAEHYFRIVTAAQAYNSQMQQPYRRPEDDQDDDGDGDEAGEEQAVVQMRHPPQPSPEGQGNGDQARDGDERPVQQQRDNRDNRGNRDNRDQNNQNFNRDRNRPRWQDRRDQPQGQGSGEQRGNIQPPQPRSDEQPRETAPAPRAEEQPDGGQWEAPSFLRRPAPLPQPEPVTAAMPAPDAPSEAAAPEWKPKRAYTRKEKPAGVTVVPVTEAE